MSNTKSRRISIMESMFNKQSSPTSFSLEDLTSLSSISSFESTSIYSSNHSTVSSCNESRLKANKNKSLPQINYDLENISTSSSSSCSPSFSPTVSQSSSSSLSALINQRLRQKMKMLNIHPDNLRKSYKKVTFNSEHRNGQTVDIMKETIEKQSISHKLPNNMEKTTEVKKITNNQPNKSETLQSTKFHNPNDSIPVNPMDISSVSSIEVAPSTIKQFKYMIEKQKSYLDCLQRELNRLQRMEDVLSELNYKSELQKRMVNDLSYSTFCESHCKDCACQMPYKQDEDEDQPQQDANFKPTEPEDEPVEDLSDTSTVESVISVATPIDQTSDVTCSEASSQSVSRLRSKEKIHSIHAQIDQMINKLHEETVTKHSIGVQTSDIFIESDNSYQPQSSTTTIRKSANSKKLVSKPKIQETLTKPVAWTIIVTEDGPFKQPKPKTAKGQAYYPREDYEETSNLTLQQAFRSKCGHFLARSQARARQINIASAIRKATAESRLERQLEEFISMNQLPRYDFLTGYRTNKVKVVKPKKIFTEKEMKQQTERLYSDLPEIKKRKDDKRREENIKTHRMMAKNFSQRLKSKAVEGKTTFPLTQRLNNY